MNSTVTNQPPSVGVVETVADAEEVDPLDLEVPLYEVIDPDALDALFAATNGVVRQSGRVTFEYSGHTVAVSSDGTVVLADEPTASEEQT